MKNIKVNLGERSYKISIGAGAIGDLSRLVGSAKFKGPAVLITDKVIASKLKAEVRAVQHQLPFDCHNIVIPASERSKSLKVYTDTMRKISKKTRMHRPLVIALGGGVVGDLAGFVAATFRRGVPYVQIPTTLLAQVDSSIGGKVGIDLPEAKNLVGAFYQPKAVLIDTGVLGTLPLKQIRNGLGEIIKYAVIKSPSLFELLEGKMKDFLLLKKKMLEKVIYECAAIKARIVEKDEFDRKDVRIALNFGHTLGHAIEAASEYSKAHNHGESVAIGMLLAGEISMRLGMFKEKDLVRIKDLIKKAGLPVKAHGVPAKGIIHSYLYDKKFTAGASRFVLPKRIGSVVVVEDIPELLVKNALKNYVA
jgi:3-dehydroquinate synthase